MNIIKIDQTITTLTADLKKESIQQVAKSVSSLVRVTDDKMKKGFIEHFAQTAFTKSQDEKFLVQRQVALLILCEIGKFANLTDDSKIFDGVLNLIQDKNEKLDEIRQYASIAFGGVSLGNLEKSLPIVINFIKKQSEG